MRCISVIDPRSIYGQVPQTLLVLQLEFVAFPNEKELPPESFEAKVEIFLVMFRLWQVGQVTSPILFELNTSSSNDLPQSVHTNSKMGMFFSAD